MKYGGLDDINREILDLLSENSRISYVEIAKKVNLSRMAITERIKSMEKTGIIEKYSIIINPEKVGRNVSAFLDIETHPDTLYSVADSLKEKDCITDIYQMTGSSKLHVHLVMELNQDLERFLREEIHTIPGIKKLDCSLILSRIKVRKAIRI